MASGRVWLVGLCAMLVQGPAGMAQSVLLVDKPGLVQVEPDQISDLSAVTIRTHYQQTLPWFTHQGERFLLVFPDRSSDPEYAGEMLNQFSRSQPLAQYPSLQPVQAFQVSKTDMTGYTTGPIDTLSFSIHLETDLEYYQGENTGTNWSEKVSGETWVWRSLNKGGSHTIGFPVSIYGFTRGATLTARVRGISRDSAVNPDHRVTVTFQNQSRDQDFSGYALNDVSFPVTVTNGQNRNVTVKNTGFTNTSVDRIYVDWVKMTGRYTGTVDTTFLEFEKPVDLRQSQFLSFNVTPASRFVLIDTLSRQVVLPALRDSISSVKRIVFSVGSLTGNRWILANLAKLQPMKSLVQVNPISTGQEEMIIITHPDFRSFADDYSALRKDMDGVTSRVVETPSVYWTYSAGNPTPHAIKSFLWDEYNRNSSLKYVLLVGNSSWDHREITAKFGKRNFVPSYGNPVSDQWMVAFSDTNRVYSFIPIGRLPLTTEADGYRFISKLTEYRKQAKNHQNIKRFGFINGGFDKNEIRLFFNQTSRLINDYVYDPTIAGVIDTVIKRTEGYLDAGRETPKIQKLFKEGVGMVSFVGHAGSRTWDLMLSDVRSLPAGNTLFPFITSMTCFTGDIANPNQDSFAEEFVLTGDRGAIGFMGTSGLGYIDLDDILVRGIYTELFKNRNPVFMDAITNAKNVLAIRYRTNDRVRSIIRQYIYIGDPSLKVPIRMQPDISLTPQTLSWKLNDSTVVVRYNVQNNGRVTGDSVLIDLTGFPEGTTHKPMTIRMTGSYQTVYDTVKITQPGTWPLEAVVTWWNEEDEDPSNNRLQVPVTIPQQRLTVYNLVDQQYLRAEAKTVWLYAPRPVTVSWEVLNQEGLLLGSGARLMNGLDSLVMDLSGQAPHTPITLRYSTDDTPQPISMTFFIDETGLENRLSYPPVVIPGSGLRQVGGTLRLAPTDQLIAIGSAGFDAINTAYITSGSSTVFGQFRGMLAARIDSVTLDIREYAEFDTYLDTNQTRQLETWVRDRLATRDILAFAVKDEGSRRLTPSLKSLMRSLGSRYLDSLASRQGWAFAVKLGDTPMPVLEGWARSSLLTVYVEKNLLSYPSAGHLKIPLKTPVLLSSVSVNNQNPDGADWSLNNANWTGLSTGNQVLPVDGADTLFLRLNNSFPDTSTRLVIGESNFIPISRSGLISSLVPEPEIVVGASFSYQASLFSTVTDPLSSVSVHFTVTKPSSVLYKLDTLIFRSQSRLPLQFTVPERTLTDTGDYLLTMSLSGSGVLDEFSTVSDSLSVVVATGVDDFNPDIRLYHRSTELLPSERTLVPKSGEYEVVIGYTDYLLLDDTTRIAIYLNGAPVSAGGSLTVKQSDERNETMLTFSAGLVEGINRLDVSVQPPFGPYSVEPKTESWQVVVDGSPGIRSMANYPNPFTDETRIYLELGGLEDPASGEIHLFTINGLKIRELKMGKPVVGHNAILWDGRDQDGDRVANGVYLYRAAIQYAEKTVYQTGKMLKAE